MIRLYTDNDLDGIGCAIALKVLRPEEEIKITYCSSKKKLNYMILSDLEKMEKSDILYITDLPITEKTAKEIEKAVTEEQKQVLLFDHHLSQMWCNKYPWACIVEKINNHEYCATDLLVRFLSYKTKSEIVKSEIYERLLKITEYVRLWDTWQWQNNEDHTPKYLNYLIDIMGKSSFVEHVVSYINSDHDVLISEDNIKIIKYLEKKFNESVSFKNMHMVKMSKDGYKFGVINAESNISELGNALCRLNPDIDFIAIVSYKAVSYRSIKPEIDVSQIAVELGGGGREQTAANPIPPKIMKNFYKEIFKI